MRLLLIEDEQDIAKPLVKALERRNFAVDWIDNGKKGLAQSLLNEYDCIILDLNLPDLDGLDIAKNLRKDKNTTPILILTARSGHDSLLSGFESGTDDYLTKPFDLKELVYRIGALIRRNSYNKMEVFRIGNVKFDVKALKVTVNGNRVALNNKELGILEYLVRNRGRVVSQEEILEHVWDREIDLFTQTVRTNIKTLRKKMDPDKKIIKTIKGKGYVIEK
ncbi:response regulator transcription factor [Candidatus Dojkabacteria bacterium]|nr:response regulator transcription factor [Candidatus Dojkabacteria bacterium]